MQDMASMPFNSPVEMGEASAADPGSLSEEELVAAAKAMGFDVVKQRRQFGGVSRRVYGNNKTPISINLPVALRTVLGHAKVDLRRSESSIVEEALVDWFGKHDLSVPEFTRSWEE